MFFVYILINTKTEIHYIGSTNNLERRLDEHNRGHTKSTISHGIWRIIYTEQYVTSSEAVKRERQIKSYKGGNAFKTLIAGVVQW